MLQKPVLTRNEQLTLRQAERLLENIPMIKVGIVWNQSFDGFKGEYDACDVTLSVYPHRASLKNMPVHGGNLHSE